MSSAKSQLDKMSTMLFNKSLSTMVKGIRNHKDKGEQEYIMKCIGEIKEELKSSYPEIKAGAVQKLIYLQMLGYDMSWASFNIVEVMSAPWFGHKRIGYLAAALAFTKDTDVILLTTHLFRKGFTQNNTANMTADGLQYETGAAISCLACICTPDLGMDLLSDIYGMMNSSRPYIRKKAVLVLLKIFRAWPQALRLSFDRLKDKLNDENQGVVSAAVYVICELAAKNPTNYLRLAPQFYKILTSSSNNWVLIKVVKLLGSLVPEEPRLAKKLMEPLSDIINTTPAKSLLYECVNTLLSGRLTSKTVIRLCLDKLRTFIEDPDQNLKYLGLLGLHKLMKKHPRVVAEHKDLILDCLKDDDVTIRMRALDLITSMVSKKNLTGIVRRLIDHLDVSDGAYREHVLERIIYICSQENYAYISNFEWYISILVDLTHITGASRENALRISSQLMDVVIRVPAVRRYGVRAMTDLLITERLLVHNSSSNAMSEVLYAAAFLVGEFAEYVEEHLELVTVMLKSQVSQLSQSVQNVFIQSFVKVLAGALMQPFDVADKDLEAVFDPEEKRSRDKLAALARDTEDETTADGDEIEEATEDEKVKKQNDNEDDTDDATLLSQEEETGLRKLRVKAKKRTFEQWKAFIQQQMDIIMLQLPVFTHSNYVEVQERAVCYHAFITWLQGVFNNPQSVLSSSTSTSTPSSTTTSEITIASPPPVTTPAPAPVLDLLSQFDPNASSTPVAAPTPAPVTPVPTITSPTSTSTSSSGPNPRELLRSIANQFAALFSERLNPVNPKAQKKVPVPKGLDLDAQINEEEHDAESESDIESDDGYSLEDPEDKKKKKDQKKKHRNDSDEEETEYVKPTTKEDREEATKRLAARKQRQENDPFYIKDRPNSSGYSGRSSENHTSSTGGSDFQTEGDDVDAIPMKRLEDGDLPPVHVKKSDKKSRRKHDLDDEFEEKVTVKNYKIQAADEMPEDAEDSGDDKPHRKASEDELNVDLTTPLGQDEIIPRVQAYNSRPVVTEKPVDKSKMSKEERKAAKAAKKEKRREERGEDKKDKKKKKDKSKDKEKDKDGDKEKDKKKKKKSDDKAKETDDDIVTSTSTSTTPAATSPATANVLDLFDPMMDVKPTPAPTPVSPPPTSTKSTPSASPKSEHKSMENGSSIPTTEELLKFRDLYHDSRLTIRYRMQPINTTSLALHVEFAYGSKSEKPEKSSSKSLTSLSLEFSSTKPFKFPTSRLTLASLSKGQPVYQSTVVEFAGGVITKPIAVPIQVIYSSSSSDQKKKKSEWSIPISVLIQPKKIQLTELGQILSNNKTNQLATKAITLSSVSVSTALKLIGAILNVSLIEAVSFTATYYGIYIPDNSHICVLVKAKKGDNKNVNVEIKSNIQAISDALIKECCKELE